MYEMIEREEIIKSYTFPTKPSSDDYYRVYVKDSTVKSGRRQFKSKTLDDLKDFLFPADTKNGTITNMAVYGVYRRVCNKLGIPISKDLILGPHSFRRNAITDVANATNGNMVMASLLFGNSPQVAMSNYYGGANLMDAKDILEQRKYLRFG